MSEQGDRSGKRDDVAVISQAGYNLTREGKLAEAIAKFEQVLKIEPTNSYALVGLGDIARKQHRAQDAIDYYQRCLEHDEQNAFALFGLADSYRSLRKYHQALKVWERYLKHDNENVTVLTRVADAYRKVREKRRSRELYLRVLDLEKDNPYALIGLGHLHYDFREYDEALEYWMRMYRLSGEKVDIRVLTSIGNSYRKLKDFQAGIPYFEQALEMEPDNFYALFGMADCYRGLNEAEASLVYWNRILDKDPRNKVILTRAGDAYRGMGELDEAERCYHRALEIDADLYATLGLAIVARTRGETARALDMLETLKESDPDNHRVYIELAATYVQSGSPSDAVRVLESFNARSRPNAYIQELIERYRDSRR